MQTVKLIHLHAVAVYLATAGHYTSANPGQPVTYYGRNGVRVAVPLSTAPKAIAARARHASRTAGLAELAATTGLQREPFEAATAYTARLLQACARARAAHIAGGVQ